MQTKLHKVQLNKGIIVLPLAYFIITRKNVLVFAKNMVIKFKLDPIIQLI